MRTSAGQRRLFMSVRCRQTGSADYTGAAASVLRLAPGISPHLEQCIGDLLEARLVLQAFLGGSAAAVDGEREMVARRPKVAETDVILGHVEVRLGGFAGLGRHLGEHADFIWHRLVRSEEHTSELQSRENLVCRLL